MGKLETAGAGDCVCKGPLFGTEKLGLQQVPWYGRAVDPYEGMDLLDLLVLASGETDDADMSKILIIRNNKVEMELPMQNRWLILTGSLSCSSVPSSPTWVQ